MRSSGEERLSQQGGGPWSRLNTVSGYTQFRVLRSLQHAFDTEPCCDARQDWRKYMWNEHIRSFVQYRQELF